MFQGWKDLVTEVHQNKNSPGLSPKTIRGMHVMLHKALEQAAKEELIKKNPTNDCTPPKVEKGNNYLIDPSLYITVVSTDFGHL